VLASLSWVTPSGWDAAVSTILAGVGLIAGGIGWGALLLLAMEGVLLLLGRYARLHYQLLKPRRGHRLIGRNQSRKDRHG
jgi:hypothetical protein